MDDLITEQDHLKLQIASIFTSIEQVETRECRENETTEEYYHCRALANLRKMRFMKQMEKLIKTFKEDTDLTHMRPMPKPTNENILTKKLSSDIPDNLLMPNIENDIEDELTRLGLDTKLLTTTNTTIEKKQSGKKSTLVSDSSSPSVHKTRQQVKITTQITEKIEEKLQQNNSTNDDTSNSVSRPDDNLPGSLHDTAEDSKQLSSQFMHVYAAKVQNGKQHEEEEEDDDDVEFSPVIQEQENKYNTVKKHEKEKEQKEKIPTNQKQMQHKKKLTCEQHKTAYPWAHEASAKCNKKTPLADEVEYIRHHDITKMLTDEMKKLLIKTISLPEQVIQEIDQKIEQTEDHATTPFCCTICSQFFKK